MTCCFGIELFGTAQLVDGPLTLIQYATCTWQYLSTIVCTPVPRYCTYPPAWVQPLRLRPMMTACIDATYVEVGSSLHNTDCHSQI